MFKKSAIFKQQSFTQHALCCKACDLEFWEAVGRVPFDQRKFRKFEPVIFVEWKAPWNTYFKRKLYLHYLELTRELRPVLWPLYIPSYADIMEIWIHTILLCMALQLQIRYVTLINTTHSAT